MANPATHAPPARPRLAASSWCAGAHLECIGRSPATSVIRDVRADAIAGHGCQIESGGVSRRDRLRERGLDHEQR